MLVIASLGIQNIYLNFAALLKNKIDPLFCMKLNLSLAISSHLEPAALNLQDQNQRLT